MRKNIYLQVFLVVYFITLFGVKAQTSVYFCSKTNTYGFSYGTDDLSEASSKARKNCIQRGGVSPKKVISSDLRGYSAIAVGEDDEGDIHVGAAVGYDTRDEAEEMAKQVLRRNGWEKNARIEESFYDEPGYGEWSGFLGRTLIPIANNNFSASDNVGGELNRFTFYWTTGQINTDCFEFLLSTASYSGNDMEYKENTWALGYGYILGTAVNNMRFYLRGVGGFLNYNGEMEMTILGDTDYTEFSEWSWYFNAVAGMDLFIAENMGITAEVGLSRIPIISLGLVW